MNGTIERYRRVQNGQRDDYRSHVIRRKRSAADNSGVDSIEVERVDGRVDRKRGVQSWEGDNDWSDIVSEG